MFYICIFWSFMDVPWIDGCSVNTFDTIGHISVRYDP